MKINNIKMEHIPSNAKAQLRNAKAILIIGILISGIVFVSGCLNEKPAESSSGLKQVTVKVPTGPDGLTVEQRNIARRLTEDNKPGTIKYLYVVSAQTGQVLFSSIVDGKVTSSGKRITPYTLVGDAQDWDTYFNVEISGQNMETAEVLQDDGSYGNSIDYLYWWDVNDRYRKLYPSAGIMIIESDTPLTISPTTFRIELYNGTDI